MILNIYIYKHFFGEIKSFSSPSPSTVIVIEIYFFPSLKQAYNAALWTNEIIEERKDENFTTQFAAINAFEMFLLSGGSFYYSIICEQELLKW